jgi:hypothetical protein
MNVKNLAALAGMVILVAVVCLAAGCASVEKRADLTYMRATEVRGGPGEVYLAKPLIDGQLRKIPGRTILGSVQNTGTQIVTTDDASDWIGRALTDELRHAGYEVRSTPALPPDVNKGILVRVTRLSADQEDKGIILSTSTEMELSAEIWKDGRLSKTLTVKVSTRDEGIDRSGEPVGASLRKTLQSAMVQLMPGIVGAL